MPDAIKNAARYLSVFYSFPLPLVKKFISDFGEQTTRTLLEKFNSLPKTSLSVNTLKISRDDFLAKLLSDGFAASHARNSKISVKIDGSANPCQIFGFEEGLFFVQDEASAVAVEALGVRRGDTVIDVCSCPGGKSFAAYIISGGADVYSFDLHQTKLSLVSQGAKRLGLSLKIKEHDATAAFPELLGRADKVICDVPCSGLGVLAKKPDLRYKDLSALQTLPPLQLSILRESAKYLKVGGEMIYSTCTLNREENEDVVRAFLAEDGGYELVDFEVGELSSSGGMLTLMPHLHDTDGFFIAKIKRISD